MYRPGYKSTKEWSHFLTSASQGKFCQSSPSEKYMTDGQHDNSLLSVGIEMTRNRFQLLPKLFHLPDNVSAKKWWKTGYDTHTVHTASFFLSTCTKIQVIGYTFIYTSVEINHAELHFKWTYLIPTRGKRTVFWIRAKLDIIAISHRRLHSSLKSGRPGGASWTYPCLWFSWPDLPPVYPHGNKKISSRERKLFPSVAAQDFSFPSPLF